MAYDSLQPSSWRSGIVYLFYNGPTKGSNLTPVSFTQSFGEYDVSVSNSYSDNDINCNT